jgi:hypothetical protein
MIAVALACDCGQLEEAVQHNNRATFVKLAALSPDVTDAPAFCGSPQFLIGFTPDPAGSFSFHGVAASQLATHVSRDGLLDWRSISAAADVPGRFLRALRHMNIHRMSHEITNFERTQRSKECF